MMIYYFTVWLTTLWFKEAILILKEQMHLLDLEEEAQAIKFPLRLEKNILKGYYLPHEQEMP